MMDRTDGQTPFRLYIVNEKKKEEDSLTSQTLIKVWLNNQCGFMLHMLRYSWCVNLYGYTYVQVARSSPTASFIKNKKNRVKLTSDGTQINKRSH